jgi:hypothetical protein
MSEHQAARTLVKSAPELWEACSEESSLARHLKSFGEIRITRLEPETAVAWEGDRTSGTVRLEPAGWGTRVTLTARALDTPAGEIPVEPKGEPQLDLEPKSEPQPEVEPELEAPERTVEPLAPEVEALVPVVEPEPEVQVVEALVPVVEPAVQVVEALVPVVEPPVQQVQARQARVSAPEVPAVKPLRPRFFQRLFGRRRAVATPAPVAAAVAEPVAVAEPEPVVEAEPVTLLAPVGAVEQLPAPPAVAVPDPPAVAVPDPPAEPLAELDPVAALTEALDSLGRAHHRPFSRG